MSNKKIFFISILFFLVLLSCNKEMNQDIVESNTDLSEKNPDWIRERFNATYTIKFPDTYIGGINQEVVGTTFKKRRNDDKIVITGGFCHALVIPCHAVDYTGEAIGSDLDSVSYTNLSGKTAYLNRKIKILENQKDIGYFFYTDTSGGTFRDSYGRLFLNDISDSTFKMAGIIGFTSLDQEEVFDIVESIKQE